MLKPSWSFEFFPAKTDAGHAKLRQTRAELAALSPEFFSVTYGAGGSTQDRTLDTVLEFNPLGVPTAPHLSCIGAEPGPLLDLLHEYRDAGVKRIVALRGDLPSGMVGGSGRFRYACDLVEFIKENFGNQFHLEVAAYPEVHPQAKSFEHDLQAFASKVKAGADSAITQYFFNPDAYFHFIDRLDSLGLHIPVMPGIMPITNYSKLARFSDACGAEIPRWIRKQLEAYGDDSASIQAFGHDVVLELCATLLDAGVPGMHFYTMNQTGPTKALLDDLGLLADIDPLQPELD